MDLALDDLIKKKPQRAKQEPAGDTDKKKNKPRGRVDPLNTSLDTLISSTGRRPRKSGAIQKRRSDVRVIKPAKRRGGAESPRALAPRNRRQQGRQQAEPRADRRPRGLRGPVIVLPTKGGQNLSINTRRSSLGGSRTYGLASVASTRLSVQALSQVAKNVKGRRGNQRRKANLPGRLEAPLRSQREPLGGGALIVRKRSKSPPRRLTEAERLMASKIKVMAQLDKVPTPSLSQKRFMGSSTLAGVIEDRPYQVRTHAGEPLTLSDRFKK